MMMLATAMALAAATPQADLRDICALRDISNAGIAARDVSRAAMLLAPKVRVITSGNTLVDGSAAMRAAFAGTFANPAFIAMVRRPVDIVLSGATAAEHGSWQSQWRDRTVGGDYLIRWERGAEGWRAVSELYIPLALNAAPGSTPTPARPAAPSRPRRTGPDRSRTPCG
jgi:ketosteroid isomerase-like protein